MGGRAKRRLPITPSNLSWHWRNPQVKNCLFICSVVVSLQISWTTTRKSSNLRISSVAESKRPFLINQTERKKGRVPRRFYAESWKRGPHQQHSKRTAFSATAAFQLSLLFLLLLETERKCRFRRWHTSAFTHTLHNESMTDPAESRPRIGPVKKRIYCVCMYPTPSEKHPPKTCKH